MLEHKQSATELISFKIRGFDQEQLFRVLAFFEWNFWRRRGRWGSTIGQAQRGKARRPKAGEAEEGGTYT